MSADVLSSHGSCESSREERRRSRQLQKAVASGNLIIHISLHFSQSCEAAWRKLVAGRKLVVDFDAQMRREGKRLFFDAAGPALQEDNRIWRFFAFAGSQSKTTGCFRCLNDFGAFPPDLAPLRQCFHHCGGMNYATMERLILRFLLWLQQQR